jgi:hypothetical protein
VLETRWDPRAGAPTAMESALPPFPAAHRRIISSKSLATTQELNAQTVSRTGGAWRAIRVLCRSAYYRDR